MATLAELERAFIAADDAGNTEDASVFAAEIRRLRQENPSLTPEQVAAHAKKAAISSVRGESPVLAKVADIGAGATSMIRGGVSAISPELSQKLWPTSVVDKESLAYLGGQIADPAALAIGGAGFKAAQQIPKLGTIAKSVIGGALGGTAIGGLSEEGEGDAATGGAIGGALGFALPVAGHVVRGATNLIAPAFSEKAAEKAAGRLAAKAAGKRAQDVIKELETGAVTGTAGETALPAGSAGFSSITSLVKGMKGSEYGDITRAAEATRLSELKAIAPDLASSVARRDKLSGKYYQKAFNTTIPIDAKLTDLFGRMPTGTMEAAANIARMEGRAFTLGTPQNPKISGESLHYIKRALSDISNAADPAKGIGRDAQIAARGVLSDFLNTFETKIPSYGTARKLYSKLSEPINQNKVITELASVLEKPTGGERIAPFLNVLGRGEQSLLKKSTGFPRYETGDLQKVLTPTQFKTVSDIAEQLKSGVDLSAREAEGMKEALLAIRATENKNVRLPALVNYKIGIVNSLLNRLEGIGGARVEKKLAELAMPGRQRDLAARMTPFIGKQPGMLGEAIKYQGGITQGMLGDQQ